MREALRALLATRPVLQSPMAGVQDHQLAIAVHRGNGIGAIPAAMLTPAQVRDQVNAFHAQTASPSSAVSTTEQPLVNVNFFCHQEQPFNAAKHASWLQALSKYYQEYEVARPSIQDIEMTMSKGSRRPFSEAHLDELVKCRPKIISFHFGLPDESLFKKLRSSLPHTMILASATTLKEALYLEDKGVDGIVLQGSEAGGHRGMFLPESRVETQVGIVPLLRACKHSLRDRVPLIAAGGISDMDHVAAMRLLGASGVQVGSCLLASKESQASAFHKRMLLEGQKSGLVTAITNVFTGKPARGLVTRLVADLNFVDSNVVPPFPQAATLLAPLRSAAEKRTRNDFSSMWSGQSGLGSNPNPESSATSIIMNLDVAWISASPFNASASLRSNL